MMNFTKPITLIFMLTLLSATLVWGQIPPDQKVVFIEQDGIDNIGIIESTINADTLEGGVRANPNRVYMLKSNGVYFMQSPILFGGDDVPDTTSTLIIMGEEGGNKPIVLSQPADGQNQFSNQVHGSLTLRNLYWPGMNLAGGSASVFTLRRSNQRLICEGLIGENQHVGAYFQLRPVRESIDIYLKDSYFRDNSQLANSWNHSVFARGDNGEAIDTLWIENTTVTMSSMPFFGKQNPVNFFFFNHNTIVNGPKYPMWMEQIKEGYITNNLFINSNYEGECQSTWETQLPDGERNGIIIADTIRPDWWVIDPPPAMEDVKFLASNNLLYFSPFLTGYYNGERNDKYDVPASNRSWSLNVSDEDLPIPVSNIPVPLISDRTQGLLDAYPNFRADNNYDNDTDPQLVTKGIASQEVANEFIKFMRNNYGVAEEGETFDRLMMWFGDADPTTVPGNDTEDGGGMPDVSGMPEDFSYTSGLVSTIDGEPLGALSWWAGKIDEYDSAAALAEVVEYYNNLAVNTEDIAFGKDALIDLYPNPATEVLTIESDLEVSTVTFYNLVGQVVKQISINSAGRNTLPVADLANGLYVVQVEFLSGKSGSTKFIKK